MVKIFLLCFRSVLCYLGRFQLIFRMLISQPPSVNQHSHFYTSKVLYVIIWELLRFYSWKFYNYCLYFTVHYDFIKLFTSELSNFYMSYKSRNLSISLKVSSLWIVDIYTYFILQILNIYYTIMLSPFLL